MSPPRCQTTKVRKLAVLVRAMALALATLLLAGREGAGAEAREGPALIPDYTGWPVEQEATTYRPGTDLQFYPLELTVRVNPQDPAEMVVELRRGETLYILYHYSFTSAGPQWAIYMDAGFAKAPCGFFDPRGVPTGRYVRIDLQCLRSSERADRLEGR